VMAEFLESATQFLADQGLLGVAETLIETGADLAAAATIGLVDDALHAGHSIVRDPNVGPVALGFAGATLHEAAKQGRKLFVDSDLSLEDYSRQFTGNVKIFESKCPLSRWETWVLAVQRRKLSGFLQRTTESV
jgi:hypothetical protein